MIQNMGFKFGFFFSMRKRFTFLFLLGSIVMKPKRQTFDGLMEKNEEDAEMGKEQ